jgi:exopolysaccharide biosynthesis polyprenyl glycosylphosphotransferase
MEASAAPATTARSIDTREAQTRSRISPDTALRRLLGLGDALAVAVAAYLALIIPGRDHGLGWGALAVPLMVVLFKLYGLYDRDTKRISHSTVDDLPWLLHAIVTGGLLFWFFARITPLHRLDLEEILFFTAGMAVLVPSARAVVRHGVIGFLPRERALVVGQGAMAGTLVRKLGDHPEYRVDVVGTLTPGAALARSVNSDPGEINERLTSMVELEGVTRVLLVAGDLDDSEMDEMLRRCRQLSLKVSILPRLSDMLGPAVELDHVEGITVLGISPPRLPRSSRALKRAIDIAAAGALLTVCAPILIAAAVAIKLDTPGPVLFRQERIGKGGRRFRLFKLRTMVRDAERQREQLLVKSVNPNWLFLDHDPRITRVGRRLRRLSLDELPQLWNVLRGDMSMVGPRPLIPTEDERVEQWARGRLELAPGLTGYWQVLGRTSIPFEEMVKLDYLYVVNWSLWEDIRLMLRTLPVVLKGQGAN